MTTRKEWSKDETLNLITVYKENSELWNTRDIEYRNRDKKNKIMQEIATNFECSTEEVQRKIHNLRNQMSQELRKNKKKKGGSGINKVNTSKWPYFGALKFLIPFLCTTATKSSLAQAAMSIVEDTTEALEYGTVKNAASQERATRTMQLLRKRKHEENDISEQLFKSALQMLQREPGDYDKFGQYVALELKSLKSEFNKARLKSEIRKIIVRIADEDLYGTTSSVSTPTPSSAFQSEPELKQYAESAH